ncbi:lactonase family protein [Niveispirillum sp. KHB5.9]|uniref:lactonase family protein n=1 Tax=Niveispirillum sp. KHB5.9 TaxID=3400269 RepID=UPI003A8901B1
MRRLHAGTYDRRGGAGLHPIDHSSTRGWMAGDPYGGARNASFGAWSPRHNLHYLVDEGEGTLGVFREEEGWYRLARVSSHGGAPCYLALSADETLLAVANYAGGNIALFRLDPTGLPIEPPQVRGNEGGGPVKDRQEGPHAHCTLFSPDQRWLYHVDLGTDEVLAHALDPTTGTLGECRLAFCAPAGSGPRHLLFHPTRPQALLLAELASTLTVLDVGEGSLSPVMTLSTLAPDVKGESFAGHLLLNDAGTRVHVTNRGQDSIASFAWDEVGALHLVRHVPSGGASPRFCLLIDGERRLAVANEEAGNVALFDIRADGTPSPFHTVIPLKGAAYLFVARQG